MDPADFIEANAELIIKDWGHFSPPARQFGGRRPDEGPLRTVKEILIEVIADLRKDESPAASALGANRERPRAASRLSGQAKSFAEARRKKRYTLDERAPGYRLLRAGIVRQWTDGMSDADRDALQQPFRLDQSFDRALSKSFKHHSVGLARKRDLFEGILAHDLHSSLQAMTMSASYQLQIQDLSHLCIKAVLRIQVSGTRMSLLEQRLLDLTRTRLGDVLPISTGQMSIKDVCQQAIDEVEAFGPDREVTLASTGDILTDTGQRAAAAGPREPANRGHNHALRRANCRHPDHGFERSRAELGRWPSVLAGVRLIRWTSPTWATRI
ncbi:HAMP domain-containing histidine kinase [Burkholderia multivorans]|jgi:signal transduction histidine kinase|nr:HAMP domain-containing histidine kinase [Burkholderia multivorans]